MRKAVVLAGAVLGAVALLGAAEKAAPPPGPEPVAARPAPVHNDLGALEKAVVDATLAYVRGDSKAARAALDRVSDGCRRLGREDNPKSPDGLIEYDQAFHKTVDLAREFATTDQIERSFDQFVWAQRACRVCHGLARKEGLMAESLAAPKPAL